MEQLSWAESMQALSRNIPQVWCNGVAIIAGKQKQLYSEPGRILRAHILKFRKHHRTINNSRSAKLLYMIWTTQLKDQGHTTL